MFKSIVEFIRPHVDFIDSIVDLQNMYKTMIPNKFIRHKRRVVDFFAMLGLHYAFLLNPNPLPRV
jgi:hypothetical protein